MSPWGKATREFSGIGARKHDWDCKKRNSHLLWECSCVQAHELCKLFKNKGISPEKAIRQVHIVAFHTQGARQIGGMTKNLTIEEQTFQETEEARSFYVYMEVANISLAGVTDSSSSQPSTFNTRRNPLQNISQSAMAKWTFLRAFCLPRPCLFALIFPLCASAQMPLCIRLSWPCWLRLCLALV